MTDPDQNITRLLDRAARSYQPDTSVGLARVHERAERRSHLRRTIPTALAVLALVATGVSVALVLSSGNESPVVTARYLRIPPSSRLVSVSTPINGLTDVSFADARHGLAMDKNCSVSPTSDTSCALTIVRTGNGGRTWTPVGPALHVTYPDSRESYPFIDFATNGKDGWIFGSKTFVTHDGGRTFTGGRLGGLVMDLSMVGDETWAVSRPCPPGVPGCVSTVYSAPTGGGPWHRVGAAPMLAYPYIQLLRSSADDAFLAAESGDDTLYVTDDGGSTWVGRPLPGLCAQLLHLTAGTGPGSGVWALCSGPAPADDQAKALYHSVNAGRTWVLVATSTTGAAPGVGALPAAGIVTLVTSAGPDRFWIALDQGSLLASFDGGRTWTVQHLPTRSDVMQLTFTSAQHGWALVSGGDTLYRTSDGGRHWATVSR